MPSTTININMATQNCNNILLHGLDGPVTSVKGLSKEIAGATWDYNRYRTTRINIMNASPSWYHEIPGTGGNTSPGVNWTKVTRSEVVSSAMAPMFKNTKDICILYVICEMICQCMKKGKLTTTEWTFPDLGETDWSNPEAVLASYRQLCDSSKVPLSDSPKVDDDEPPQPPPYKRFKPNEGALVPFQDNIVQYEDMVNKALSKYCEPVVLNSATFRGQLEDALYNGVSRTEFLRMAEKVFDRLTDLKLQDTNLQVVQATLSLEQAKCATEKEKRIAEEAKCAIEKEKRIAEEAKCAAEKHKGVSKLEVQKEKTKGEIEKRIAAEALLAAEKEKRIAAAESRDALQAPQRDEALRYLRTQNTLGSEARRKPCTSTKPSWKFPSTKELEKVSVKARPIQNRILHLQKNAFDNPDKANFKAWSRIVKNSTISLSALQSMLRCQVFEQSGKFIKRKFNMPASETGEIQSIVLVLINPKTHQRVIKHRLTRV